LGNPIIDKEQPTTIVVEAKHMIGDDITKLKNT